MSINELNTTAHDLMSVRAMIAELEAEAEALTDKLKTAMTERGEETIQGDAGLTVRLSRLTTLTCTASTASRPRPPVLFSAYEKGPIQRHPTKGTLNEAHPNHHREVDTDSVSASRRKIKEEESMKDIKFGMQRAGCAMISDFMVGIKAVKEAHNARKEGASGLRITPVKTIPVVCLGYWDWTPECLRKGPAQQ